MFLRNPNFAYITSSEIPCSQTNKPRSSRGLVIFDTLWQFFVIVFGWIGRIEKILSNNERQIINFKANFVDETVISGISGHE